MTVIVPIILLAVAASAPSQGRTEWFEYDGDLREPNKPSSMHFVILGAAKCWGDSHG